MRRVGFAVVPGALALTSCAQFEVRVLTGTFLFEAGQKVALELTGENPCPCYCGTIEVVRFSVRDANGSEIYVDRSPSYPVAAGAWIGRWDLTSGGKPVPMDFYSLLVETSLGTFQAEIQVVAPGAAPAGWGKAEAPVWGMGLRGYRLVEEGDGPTVSRRVGVYLLVALPGHPTTGFGWEVKEKPDFLTRIEGQDYRPSSDLIGAGGTFYFRDEVTASGTGTLAFAYRRPWEDVPPEKTFSLQVTVP